MCRLESPPETMVQGGLPLSRDAIYSLLQVCIKEKDLAGGRLAHSLMVRGDLDGLVVLGDHLIRLFAACGSLLESNLVFCMVSKPSVYTWQAIISAHATMGEHEKALHLYNNMQQEGVEPGEFVFSSILKACGGIGSIEQGRSIHDHIIVNGLESNLVLGSSLVDMYVKCGHLVEARSVFDFMPTKNIVSWSAMMAGYVQHGCGLPALELFEAMQEEGIRPDKVTLLCTLQACGCVGAVLLGRVMHEEIIRNIFTPDAVIGNALVHMYAKCGSLEEALNVFNKLLAKTVVSYGAMISGYTQHGHDIVAMELFRDMLREGIEPNEVLFLCLLKACGSRGAINVGRLIHIQIIESQLEPDVVIGSALIDMYAKCGSLKESHNVLLALPCRDVVSWGVIISGYSQYGYGIIALELFKEMQKEGIKPDEVTLLGVLKACGSMSGIQQARLIHGQIAENGLESDTALGNALVDTYLRCGSIEEAMKTLDRLPNRNMVTWNTVIAVCTHHGHDLSAIEIFKTMQQDCVKPDIFMFSILLKTCGSIGAIEQGKQIHEQMLRSEHELDLVIGTTLVDMYAKCGYLKDAHKILDGMPHRDVVSWNALIAGYTQHGNCKQAVQCFKNLQKQGLKPDAHTYASILAACSHVGALEEAHHYFTSMTDHGITPGIEHLNSMTDLLGRLGHLDEAEKLVGTMPDVADIVSWRSLLTSCRTYGDSNLGRQCFDQAVTLRPNSAAGYVLMSNIYADAQRWDDVDDIQDQKTSADASKKPGRAWIEVGNKVQEFTVGDKSHIASERICLKLQNMRIQLKEKGYLPQSGFLCGAESKQRSNRCIM